MSDPRASPSPARALGLLSLTALVVGNMVGSGVFLLPASLAPFGAASILGWCVTAAGSMLLGLVIARLARRTGAAGGPYAYVREAFGEFAAFLVGWGYWISCWCAQAAIAVTMVGYLGELVPGITRPPRAAAAAIAAILLLALVNISGLRRAGTVQVLTTVLKLLPLVAIACFGLARFDPEHLTPLNPSGRPLWSAVQGCLALTLWAFLGFESAAVATGAAREPRRDVPRATLHGITLVSVFYVAGTLAVMGLVPRAELAESTRPFADAARILWGPWAAKLVAAGAFVSCFGALNGWILVSGQLPLAIARDGLFPAFFARLTLRGTPGLGLLLSSALGCALVYANQSRSLVAMFDGMILLSTLAALMPLVFSAMAELLLAARARRAGASEPLLAGTVISLLAFAYGLLAIGGAGHETVSRGFLLLLTGIPFYVLARARARS
jgi:APA family basic amino acid/polyamine antiporter